MNENERVLPSLEKGKQAFGIHKIRRGVNIRISCGCVVLVTLCTLLTAEAAGSDSFLETPSAQRGEQVLDSVQFDVARNRKPVTAAFNSLYELCPQWGDGSVELLSFVSCERDSVSDKNARQKREGTYQDRVRVEDSVKRSLSDWLQWASIPLVWLFAGLLVGGAFQRPRPMALSSLSSQALASRSSAVVES